MRISVFAAVLLISAAAAAQSPNADRPQIGGVEVELRDGVGQQALESERLFALVAPSVYVVRAYEALDGGFQGSAVAIQPHRLLTNCHVVRNSRAIYVVSEGRAVAAKLEVQDAATDRCILYVDARLRPVKAIRTYASLRIGERVYSVGAPRGLELTIGEGLVSGKREASGRRFVQTSAPVSPGSSGGGLFDPYGNLIAITTFTLRESQNINFAIPAEDFASPGSQPAPTAPQPAYPPQREKPPAPEAAPPSTAPAPRPSSEIAHRIATPAGLLTLEKVKIRSDDSPSWVLRLDGSVIEQVRENEPHQPDSFNLHLVIPSRAAPEFVVYSTLTCGNRCSDRTALLDVGPKDIGPKPWPYKQAHDLPDAVSGGLPEIKIIAPGVLQIRGLSIAKTALGDPALAVFTYDRGKRAIWEKRHDKGFDYSRFISQHPSELLAHEIARKPLVAIIDRDKFLQFRTFLGVASMTEVRWWRYLVGQGCKPHDCSSKEGIYIIDITSDRAVALMRQEQQLYAWGGIGSEEADWAVRAIINKWLRRWSLRIASTEGQIRIVRDP